MFGLFCGSTPPAQNSTADARPKADVGTLARLKGFFGLEGGNVEESGEGTTEKGVRRTSQQSKRCVDSMHRVRSACATICCGQMARVELIFLSVMFAFQHTQHYLFGQRPRLQLSAYCVLTRQRKIFGQASTDCFCSV